MNLMLFLAELSVFDIIDGFIGFVVFALIFGFIISLFTIDPEISIIVSIVTCVFGIITGVIPGQAQISAVLGTVYIAMFMGEDFWKVNYDPDVYEYDHKEESLTGRKVTFYFRPKRTGGYFINTVWSFLLVYAVAYAGNLYHLYFLGAIIPTLFLIRDIFLLFKIYHLNDLFKKIPKNNKPRRMTKAKGIIIVICVMVLIGLVSLILVLHKW